VAALLDTIPRSASMSEVQLSPPPGLDETAQIMAEHELLKEALARLEVTRDVAVLAELLAELADLLDVHFAREERMDGIVRDVGTHAPHRVDALSAVLAEHNELRRAVSALVESARACLAGPIAALYAGVEALREALHSHEARENEIFLDAMYTDYGTGD
jgi:iron-sulfur cluster repair protein YtfE (RIC family)